MTKVYIALSSGYWGRGASPAGALLRLARETSLRKGQTYGLVTVKTKGDPALVTIDEMGRLGTPSMEDEVSEAELTLSGPQAILVDKATELFDEITCVTSVLDDDLDFYL